MNNRNKPMGVLQYKLTKRDKTKIYAAFDKKVEEYSKLTLEELKELYPILGGTYREACLFVVERKLQLEKNTRLQEAIDDLKTQTNEPTA